LGTYRIWSYIARTQTFKTPIYVARRHDSQVSISRMGKANHASLGQRNACARGTWQQGKSHPNQAGMDQKHSCLSKHFGVPVFLCKLEKLHEGVYVAREQHPPVVLELFIQLPVSFRIPCCSNVLFDMRCIFCRVQSHT